MLFKLPGLVRSPDQTGRRSRSSEEGHQKARLAEIHKCYRGKLPIFNKTGNPKARPGLAERDTWLLNIIRVRMAMTLKRVNRKSSVVIGASRAPRQTQLALVNKDGGTTEAEASRRGRLKQVLLLRGGNVASSAPVFSGK